MPVAVLCDLMALLAARGWDAGREQFAGHVDTAALRADAATGVSASGPPSSRK